MLFHCCLRDVVISSPSIYIYKYTTMEEGVLNLLCLCLDLSIYIRIYVCLYTRIPICVHIYIYMNIYAHIYSVVYMYVYSPLGAFRPCFQSYLEKEHKQDACFPKGNTVGTLAEASGLLARGKMPSTIKNKG